MIPRRAILKAIAATGILGPAGISGLISDVLAKGQNPVAPGIYKITGDVRVNGKPASPGMLIRTGDTVVTARDAEAIYVIDEDAYLQRGGTTVNFGAEAARQLLRVVTGRLLSVFGRRERTIQVSTATIGIRGTGCYIEDEGEGAAAKTYFCLCYGSAELVPTMAPKEREAYATQHHDHPLYIYNDKQQPKMMVPAEVINHGDDELTLLEALVARRPPFWGQQSYGDYKKRPPGGT